MLTIKDLAVSKSLDSKEMAAVHGGSNFSYNKSGDIYQVAQGSQGGKNGLNVGNPVTQVGLSGPAITTQLHNPVNVLGEQFAL